MGEMGEMGRMGEIGEMGEMGEVGEIGEMFVVTTSVVLFMFVVTTSVVSSLLGVRQVTPPCQALAPVPQQVGGRP